jgi:hypothetical protein
MERKSRISPFLASRFLQLHLINCIFTPLQTCKIKVEDLQSRSALPWWKILFLKQSLYRKNRSPKRKMRPLPKRVFHLLIIKLWPFNSVTKKCLRDSTDSRSLSDYLKTSLAHLNSREVKMSKKQRRKVPA